MGLPLGGEVGVRVNVIEKSGRARVVEVFLNARVLSVDLLSPARSVVVTEVS